MKSLTLRELLEVPVNESAFNMAAITLALSKFMFTLDKEASLVYILLVDEMWRWHITTTLRARILHLCRKSVLTGHSSKREMYKTMRRHFYWPNMCIALKNTLVKAFSRTRTRWPNKKQRRLKLIPPVSPIDFFAIDILRPLQKARGEVGAFL